MKASKVLSSRRGNVTEDGEEQFHAWPDYNALMPTRKEFGANCVSHVILIKDVPGVETGERLAMQQTW
jgi:hypothetical protein